MRQTTRRNLDFVLVPMLALVAAAQLEAQQPARARLVAAIDSIVESVRAQQKVPGISVAIARGADMIHARGYGEADIENDVAAGVPTVYRIGSITKQFTAAAVMKLVEEGRIALDDPVTKYLPEFPLQGHDVRVRHLLNHTSGIRSYTGIPAWRGTNRLDYSTQQVVDLFKEQPFDFAPDENYRYNNSAYFLLGMILEKVTGKSYAQHLRDTMFQPLGLAATSYCGERDIIEHRAEGYARQGEAIVNDDPMSMTHPFSAGALCSTVGDLVTWTRALAGGRVVSKQSFTQMTTPGKLKSGRVLDYGFGLAVARQDGHRKIAHGGGINGFSTFLSYYPDDDLVIAVLANAEYANPGAIERRLARLVLGIAEPVVKRLPLAPAERQRYTGTYESDAGRMTISERDGKLFFAGPANFELLHQGEGVFLAAEEPEFRLTFTLAGGRATALTIVAGGNTIQARRVQ